MLAMLPRERHDNVDLREGSPIKRLLQSLKISVGYKKPTKTSVVGCDKVQRVASPSKRRPGTIHRERKTGVSVQQEASLLRERAIRTAAIARPSTPQHRPTRPQEGLCITTITPQTPQSTRSRSASRLAFTRSQNNPSQHRVVRIPDSHPRRIGSTTYIQDGRIQNAGSGSREASRGRKREPSSESRFTTRHAEDRTPSPPDLDRTPSGTPCSSISDGPTTPITTRSDLRIDIKPEVSVEPGMLSSLPEVEEDTRDISTSDADVFDCPEDYYRLPSITQSGFKIKLPTQIDLHNSNEDVMRYRIPAAKNTLLDGSQLQNVGSRKPQLARPTSTMSTIPILDQTSPIYPPTITPWNTTQHTSTIPMPLAQTVMIQQPALRVSQQASSSTVESATIPDMIEVNKTSHRGLAPGPDILPRKPVSYERLRPASVAPHGVLPPLPEQMLPHRRTRSNEPPPTRPPLCSQSRSATTYSYVPTHDTRADRRSYNTVRILDSQGRNHERLRQVLGI